MAGGGRWPDRGLSRTVASVGSGRCAPSLYPVVLVAAGSMCWPSDLKIAGVLSFNSRTNPTFNSKSTPRIFRTSLGESILDCGMESLSALAGSFRKPSRPMGLQRTSVPGWSGKLVQNPCRCSPAVARATQGGTTMHFRPILAGSSFLHIKSTTGRPRIPRRRRASAQKLSTAVSRVQLTYFMVVARCAI